MRILDEISRTLGDLLIPDLSTEECVPAPISLAAPLCRVHAGAPGCAARRTQ
jgi:hypothetical protein